MVSSDGPVAGRTRKEMRREGVCVGRGQERIGCEGEIRWAEGRERTDVRLTGGGMTSGSGGGRVSEVKIPRPRARIGEGEAAGEVVGVVFKSRSLMTVRGMSVSEAVGVCVRCVDCDVRVRGSAFSPGSGPVPTVAKLLERRRDHEAWREGAGVG